METLSAFDDSHSNEGEDCLSSTPSSSRVLKIPAGGNNSKTRGYKNSRNAKKNVKICTKSDPEDTSQGFCPSGSPITNEMSAGSNLNGLSCRTLESVGISGSNYNVEQTSDFGGNLNRVKIRNGDISALNDECIHMSGYGDRLSMLGFDESVSHRGNRVSLVRNMSLPCGAKALDSADGYEASGVATGMFDVDEGNWFWC